MYTKPIELEHAHTRHKTNTTSLKQLKGRGGQGGDDLLASLHIKKHEPPPR